MKETVVSAGQSSITLHDITNGMVLASFKQTNTAPKSTAIVQTVNGIGGLILTAQLNKSIINIYSFQKDQIALKIVVPEKLSCLAVDPTGIYCAGGTASGRIYLWELASGLLMNSWDAHYRAVTVLRFSRDCSALCSGSDDSSVNVWFISQLVDLDAQNQLPTSYCTFSDHTLPVTDIHVGIGVWPNIRVFTASVDNSVKVWDIRTRTLLSTFLMPSPIHLLVVDPTERFFFTSSLTEIRQVNLFKRREQRLSEAIGGGGNDDIVRLGSDDLIRLISVESTVTAMALSLTSSSLLVGTAAGLTHVYEVATHQRLRTINASLHSGSPITHLQAILKPIDLVGHAVLTMSSASATTEIPVRPIQPFQKIRNAKAREAHEILLVLPPPKEPRTRDVASVTREELLEEQSHFISPETTSTETGGAASGARVLELESQVAELQKQLVEAKGVNDLMWETVAKKMVHGSNTV